MIGFILITSLSSCVLYDSDKFVCHDVRESAYYQKSSITKLRNIKVAYRKENADESGKIYSDWLAKITRKGCAITVNNDILVTTTPCKEMLENK